jgi:hypothetical protein
MAKNRYRRQVCGKTTKDDVITVSGVSANGNAVENARAKGCFGYVITKRGAFNHPVKRKQKRA